MLLGKYYSGLGCIACKEDLSTSAYNLIHGTELAHAGARSIS